METNDNLNNVLNQIILKFCINIKISEILKQGSQLKVINQTYERI